MISRKLKNILVLLTFIFILTTPTLVAAATPYKTYTVDGYGDVTETQTAYSPDKVITKIGDYSFSTPQDMVVTDDGYIYVADTGNQRILVSDLDGNYVKTVGDGDLVTPTGIFVTDDKTLYVADKDGKKVVVYDSDDNKIAEYTKPDSPLYGDVDFKPEKIVVNSSGNMYIICEGNTNGIVQISPVDGGTFIGYFGTNYTSTSLLRIFQRMIFTDEQKAKMLANLPSTPTNMAIDDKGLIYTVTQGEQQDTLKKLNIAGNNMITPDAFDELPAAVTTGNYDNIYVASQEGYIYEYTSEGEILFIFGGRDDGRSRIGLAGKVEAIGVDQNDSLYILDSEKQEIQIFKPTEFVNLLHQSLYLFGKGRYTESKEPLEQVLEMNSLFDYANMAMGRAYYQEENYEESLKYSRLAKDFEGYSDSFWEIRNECIRQYMMSIFFGVIAFVVLVKFIKRNKDKYKILIKANEKLQKFYNIEIIKELRYSRYYLRHPFDGNYGIKNEKQVSYLSANIIIASVIILSILNKYACGFLLKTVRDGHYDIVGDVGKVLLVFIILTSCNYLMCTINDGEARFKDLYCGYAYSLIPYVIFMPIVIILSNIVTYNEVFLVNFSTVFITVWIGILLFIALKELNDYSFKDTVKSIVLTLFTVLIVSLVAFILYVLFAQVFEFVIKISGEVAYRIG